MLIRVIVQGFGSAEDGQRWVDELEEIGFEILFVADEKWDINGGIIETNYVEDYHLEMELSGLLRIGLPLATVTIEEYEMTKTKTVDVFTLSGE